MLKILLLMMLKVLLMRMMKWLVMLRVRVTLIEKGSSTVRRALKRKWLTATATTSAVVGG